MVVPGLGWFAASFAHDGGEQVVWFAAVVGALAVILKGVRVLWRDLLKPFGQFLKQARVTYEQMEDLPTFVEQMMRFTAQTNSRLATLEGKTQAIMRDLGIESRE